MKVTEEDVRILFDLVVNSLDFGSGFVYGDDIRALCRVADALGIDRKTAGLPEQGKEPDELVERA